MEIFINHLPDNVQQYIQHQLTEGNFRSAEELVAAVLTREAQQATAADASVPGKQKGHIPPGIRRSQEAYWRDLPDLLPLRSPAQRWVAYHGDERIGFGKTAAELYQECFRRGWKEEEFFVDRLEPRALPPWEGEVIDASTAAEIITQESPAASGS